MSFNVYCRFMSYFRLNKAAFCAMLNMMKEHFHKRVRGTSELPTLIFQKCGEITLTLEWCNI